MVLLPVQSLVSASCSSTREVCCVLTFVLVLFPAWLADLQIWLAPKGPFQFLLAHSSWRGGRLRVSLCLLGGSAHPGFHLPVTYFSLFLSKDLPLIRIKLARARNA